MSSLIFEFKKNNHKDIFEVYNNQNEKNPIKLVLDSPNRINTFKKNLKEEKKFPKIIIERNRKYLDDMNNNMNIEELKPKLKEKIDDECPNKRYNSDKKMNLKISKNILNVINYEDNEIYSPKYINTVRSNKIINNNYNKCTPIKFNNNRKFIGGSPLISHSIDIINNNPYNKLRFIKNINKREKELNRILNKNNEDSDDSYFIKKNINLSPINFNKRQEKKFKIKFNIRKLSYDNQDENDIKKNCILKKEIFSELINNNKNKRRNIISDSYKGINIQRNNNIYCKIEKEQLTGNMEDTHGLMLHKINNDFLEDKLAKISKTIHRNIPLKLKNYFKAHKNKIKEELLLKEKKEEDIEYISDDELKEYYVENCNVILEYAYKEDINCSHKLNMEDKGKSIINFNNDSKKLLFCLFDGHGGDEVSTYLQNNFGKIMKKYINNSGDDEEINFDKLFKEIDEEFKNHKYYQIGSTATIIYIKKDEIKNRKILYCVNIGDTKCILTQQNGSRKLSYDDLLTDENEYNRIINEGGFIKNGRVCGQLMISRAFGDWESKSYGVTCSPHITKIEINNKCKYVILASDGIWDVLDDLDVYKFSLSAENSKKLCDDIIQNALDRETTDNLSCFVIKLND